MSLGLLRGRLRRDLRDEAAGDQRWSDEELDRHLQHATHEISLAAPLQRTATLPATAGSRDIDLGTLTDRVAIESVECPAGRYPPAVAPFSVWGDQLTLLGERTPAEGDTVLLRYGALHTLDAAGTTLPEALHDLVVTGAAAYAALEWSSYATNRVNLGGSEVWSRYHVWAQERLAAFARGLARHGRARQVRVRQLHTGPSSGEQPPGLAG